MKVILASAMGICFGVRDALAATRSVEQPAQVTIFGQLVHNPVVERELASRGFVSAREQARDPATIETDAVLITAHGVSNRERDRLAAAGKRLIDTTCPLVRKAHAAALALAKEGRFVIIIGRSGHVEVRGLQGDLEPDRHAVVERREAVVNYGEPRLGIMTQTTAVEPEVGQIVEQVRALNPASEIRFINTICSPTRERQEAVTRLLEEVDVLVVVGGRQSNNTRHLVTRAAETGVPAIHVEAADGLEETMFTPGQVVGLTAGTSTLPETIAAAHERLLRFYPECEPFFVGSAHPAMVR